MILYVPFWSSVASVVPNLSMEREIFGGDLCRSIEGFRYVSDLTIEDGRLRVKF